MIVGFNIDSMDSAKDENAKGNLQINYSPKITDVEDVKVNAFDEKVAKIEFDFTVSYEASGTQAAHISMSGNVLWKGHLDEIMESWEEDDQLPEEMNAPLMNELYRRLLSESVGVANTLGLLPPIPTPKVEQ
ncbi:hypothetical protein HRED_01466 [Candidatus Haloredivivus sp. G17]|jgi:hypothetical protein|nr:hypothetical protein HRED_01466 [Candidatus Haloredivivus sp. G17]